MLKINFKKQLIFLFQWMTNVGIALSVGILIFLFASETHGFTVKFWRIFKDINGPMGPIYLMFFFLTLRVFLSLKKKEALLFFSSLLICFLMTEVFLRVTQYPTARLTKLKQWRQPSPELGWELVPGMEGKQNLGAMISINSHGLRDHERPWQKPEGQKRILALGDSFTYGYAVSIEDTFVKQLEQQFKKTTSEVDVINAGVTAYNFFQSYIYLIKKGIQYDPDLVLYFFFIDDVGGEYSEEALQKTFVTLQNSKEFQEEKASLLSSFYLFNFLKHAALILDNKFRFLTGADWLRNIQKRKEVFAKRNEKYLYGKVDMAPFLRTLIDLKRFVEGQGKKFAMVLIPDSVQLGDSQTQIVNRILQEYTRENAIPFLDITPYFEKEVNRNELYLFPLDAHTSPKGNAFIAETVFQWLRNQEDIFKAFNE